MVREIHVEGAGQTTSTARPSEDRIGVTNFESLMRPDVTLTLVCGKRLTYSVIYRIEIAIYNLNKTGICRRQASDIEGLIFSYFVRPISSLTRRVFFLAH